MPLTREIAVDCAEEGLLQIEQKGKRVDPKELKGPIRLRLVIQVKKEDDENANIAIPDGYYEFEKQED